MSTVVCLVCFVFVLCTTVNGEMDTMVETTADLREELNECHEYTDTLRADKERLNREIEMLSARVEEMQMEDMDDEDSNESHSRSRGLRTKRASNCEAGTLAAWACAPQCIFKLKGLCGLSLKTICHC